MALSGCPGVALALAVAFGTSSANAKATYESAYGYDRTWNAALRLVRVDNGWKVVEKDEASGYILFDYTSPESSKPTPGSIELVRGQKSTAVSVLVQLAALPRYHEQVMLDALAAKMRREYGDAPASPDRRPSEPPDGGDGERE